MKLKQRMSRLYRQASTAIDTHFGWTMMLLMVGLLFPQTETPARYGIYVLAGLVCLFCSITLYLIIKERNP